MSTATHETTFSPLDGGFDGPRSSWQPYFKRTVYELVATWRQPAFAVPTLLFPAMFYLFFGVIFGAENGLSSYLVPTYGAFGVIGTGLFAFGVGMAIARESGQLRLEQVTPLPPFAFLTAKMITALVFSSLILVELFALAALFGGVRFERVEWLGLTAVLLLGTLPFAAIGLAIGTRVGGQAAPAIVNLVYLPTAFLSGLWIPIEVLPGILQKIAIVLPPYHLAQLALGIIGRDAGQPVALHVGFLAVLTAVCLLFAARAFRAGS